MEQLNVLVNAGHSPSSLARQMVRYLRNALMAKLGGEHTQLLQISGDERVRAMRTAMLFTEEELTRNLQIVLRTFDDLNYRQEQRFHQMCIRDRDCIVPGRRGNWWKTASTWQRHRRGSRYEASRFKLMSFNQSAMRSSSAGSHT